VSDRGDTLARAGLGGELHALAAALTFLTRIPVGRRLVLGHADLARSGIGFPLVGAGIGAAVGGIADSLAGPLSPLLAAAIALATGVLLTGALHLDALADTADALAARSRERALAIMRDPATGAYGTVAIVLDLLLKLAALSALAQHGHALRFAVAAGALSRISPVALAAALPYARPSGGLGVPLTHTSGPRAALAAAVAFAVAVGAAGLDGAVLAGVVGAATVVFGLAFRRWIGGVTGDTLGAATELSELIALVAAVALIGAR
jgi:adenosylcobinamide-GDP ribazoletransferase